jgi:small subunit ribosomal protein S17
MNAETNSAQEAGVASASPDAGADAPVAAKAKNTRTLIGKVVSDKRQKTITVLIERRTKHELYGKIVAKTSKYHAHDENGEYKMGDVVEIAEGRPISKTKSWVVTRLVQKGMIV